MIMDDDGLGFVSRRGILPSLPSFTPGAGGFQRHGRYARTLSPAVIRARQMTPQAVAARTRVLAAQLVTRPSIVETAAAQGVAPAKVVADLVKQQSVQASLANGVPPYSVAAQLERRPELVTDALASRPPLLTRTSPTADVTDVPPVYSAIPAEPDYSDNEQPDARDEESPEDIFANMQPDEGDSNMDMGNIRSSIQFPEVRSNLGEVGNIYSDLLTGYMTRQSQNASIALAQANTAQAQAAARIAEANARAATAKPSGGFLSNLPFPPVMLLIPVAGLGVMLYLKMRKRK